MKQVFPILILMALFFQGCRLGQGNIYKNVNIPANIRDEINALDIKLFQSLKGNDYQGLTNIMSDEMNAKSVGKFKNLVFPQYHYALSGKSFSQFDEFYLRSFFVNKHTLTTSGSGENSYEFIFPVTKMETDISLLLIGDSITQYLLTAAYGKSKGVWKLDYINLELYSLFGKSAPGLYDQAKYLYENHYLLDAANTMMLCNRCSRPADTFFRYEISGEMKDFFDRIAAETNKKYPMPMTLENINTKPSLFKIYPQLFMKKVCPEIRYLSHISMDDTLALKKENLEVQKSAGELFYGLKKNNSFIVYRAFSEITDDKKPGNNHLFIEDIAK